MIQRERGRNCLPPLPQDLETMDIPQEMKALTDGMPFLQFDSGPGADRILIFSTHDSLAVLVNSDQWFADGAFRVEPPIFHQLYTIHGIHLGFNVPLVYTLLPNKTQRTYTRLLQELKNLSPGIQPQSVLTDYEMAAIKRFEAEFPNVKMIGCYYHLTQSVWRQVQCLGLTQNFAKICQMLPCLAFLLQRMVIE
uniref:MULE transposase domain-containing protein n=1 Tax=Latimeria chalumnae TaxID=7897 RepID=H3A8W8_LATCH